ncbi:oxidoreductase [Lachnospiraceae bacterium]|uniref:oxidoreductase n=1 Tax=Extibacter sp. GGCC_0201 TaxID=2731209 RepID=UPI001AA11274|nr:FAD-dependent oxidoreductase [Extibacter sp. GGCC_0201]MBO1722661.1 FAD-dependent oxidoreductase [Extibacter sp. GGCC_0201]BDF34251.1 oxidoreductase [Lachnospiraceae bacterium]BDF38255.1 oxidoreductase [Lachnospiraceae bacterium]
MRFDNMFSPIQIGPMTVKNRFVVPPMGNNFANTDGTWSGQSAAYYAERAKGQFGLITIEATVVHEGAKGGPRKPCLYNDNSIESLKKIVDACHAEGAKVSVQLQNAGPEGNAKNAGTPIQAATAIPSTVGRDTPEEVPTAQVYELVKGYGAAARRAMQAGVDAVEIHMAHGYLVNTFISQRSNKRVDEFGGSFENRMRFPRLIIEEVKKNVGDKVAILARINSADEVPGGVDVHDSAAIAAYLEACGVQCLHVSRAVHIKDEYMWAPTTVHAGFSAELVTEIKKAVSIPVITVGRFTEPQYAELLVKEGRADLVAFGRQSLADPHMPEKAMQERLEDMIPCIACLQGCVANMYKGEPICCLTNPFLGHEAQGYPKAEKAKKVMVIGGGVAGLCAAFVCAERGHDVTLYESTGKLGGNMRLAAYPPGKGDITGMIRSYIVRCEKAGVKVRMNTAADMETVKAEKPDAVIVATGSKTLILPIEGIDNPAIIHGSDLLDGRRKAGEKVLVVGGGMVGCEIAAFLGEQQHKVSIIEFRDTMGADMISEHRKYVMKDFEEYKVEQIVNAKVCKFYDDGVEYESPDGERHEARGFDSVVLSMGFRNYNPFAEQLEELGQEVYVVGDATRARRALDATKEAYAAAMQV